MNNRKKCNKCKVNILLSEYTMKRDGEYQKNCDLCNKKDNDRRNIKKLLNVDKFKCVLCEFKCPVNTNLQKHIKSVHNKIKDFECELCDFKCTGKGNLKQHVRYTHDKIKDIKCELCDYICSVKTNLQKHIKSVHNKIKDFECELCGYKCSEKTNLQRHIKQIHDKIKDFECELCGYKCSLKETLKKHIKICSGLRNISGLESRCIEALETLGLYEDNDYVFNNSFPKLTLYCNKILRPDIRFLNHKIIIELDGKQHYEPVNFGGISQERAEENLKLCQDNDNLKNDFCKEFNYKMIRIKYTDIVDMLGILHYELLDIL